jgi:hypothetical protein
MIKDTVAPIPIELLKEYFSDDSIIFNINYADSILKGDKLITYLSNLGVPSKLSGWDGVSTEDKFALVKDYMNSKLIINSVELEVCVLKILYEASEFSFFVSYDVENILSKDEIDAFCKDNKELIDRWLTMLASCSVYGITTVTNLAESAKEEYEIIDDYDYCGVNFVQLFAHEITQELITADRKVYYFEKQFNEPMFKGMNMFSYWENEANTFAIMIWGISSGEIVHDEFMAAIEKGYEDVSVI